MKSNPVIEICCADIHSVQLAESYRADAIEICVDLSHGGLTPGIAMIHTARKMFSGELSVFFRPRNGNFIYDPIEKEIILNDIREALHYDIDTIVAGGLTREHHLDIDFMKAIIDVSMGVPISFHRAIDISNNPHQLLEQLITLQIDRVLSSGCAAKAMDGIENLTTWNALLGDKIEIMAAGGIDHTHVATLLEKTGLKRFHASLRKPIESKNAILDLGCSEQIDEDKLRQLMSLFR